MPYQSVRKTRIRFRGRPRGRGRAGVCATWRPSFIEPLEPRLMMSAVALPDLAAVHAVSLSPAVANGSYTVLTPTQILNAYGFNQITFKNSAGQTVNADGAGQTIAIVDAYDDPNIVTDLEHFDQVFGLSNNDDQGQFVLTKKMMAPSVSPDTGWAMETSLDVEWAHAIAPGAHILLVEAKSASMNDLMNAVDYAASQNGVVAVSMSWGSAEFRGETSLDANFTTPFGHIGGSSLSGGITYVASAGDSGAPPEYPGVSPNVLAVGGTTLTLGPDGSYLGETGWSDGGGGISLYESKPAYQSQVTLGANKRTSPDVAYDADPNTGLYVYDTYGLSWPAGWYDVGGTSAGSPQWAALVAIADQGRGLNGLGSLNGVQQTLPALYSMPSADFNDITSGNNGYNAAPGYDLVTGLGSPVANLLVADLDTYGPANPSLNPVSTLIVPPSSSKWRPYNRQRTNQPPFTLVSVGSDAPEGSRSHPHGLQLSASHYNLSDVDWNDDPASGMQPLASLGLPIDPLEAAMARLS